jgi:tetratricopeptide (TPR) repeat protein
MPLVDPNVSFDVAARHLFRHLADPQQLRRNPLVRRFFEDAASALLACENERAALAKIRELVVRGAEQYRRSETALSVGKEAAHRRHTIVTMHCLEGRDLESVAAALGISKRQCYRERIEAVRQIAEYVGTFEDRPKPEAEAMLSEFRLRMDRASSRVELGDLDEALREYDDIAGSDPSRGHKIEALCKSSEALLEHGDFQRAQERAGQARDLLRTQPFSSDVVDAAMSAHVHLVRSNVCWSLGRFEEDTLELRSAVECLDRILPISGDRVKELYAETQLALCDRARTRGEFGRAHEHLLAAEAGLGSVRTPTPERRFDAMVESWSLGAKDVRFEGAGTKRLGRYESLVELSSLARSIVSPKRSARLAEAFMQHHADASDREAAEKWARRALLIAKQHRSAKLLAVVSLGVADWLSITPQWTQSLGLLRAADGNFPKGGPDWILLQGLWADYALQAKRYREAVVRATEVERATERMGNPRFQASVRTTIALAAHALGEQGEAHERLLSALEVIDAYGTPWTRWSTYVAAAEITGERRHRRQASEIGRSLKVHSARPFAKVATPRQTDAG